ncbi:hypothetical protein CWE12_03705 [Aliidiomarina sedimenti]|uniref:Pilus formation protein N-terminal domain-containing protein n=1 Tax=Aliidiomarina sedimenti TaxID=1933879 RepID=A0ABY0C2S8_9GAMM|nr:pilus assembly protein N-terminal domain-containing protein [Aliidiomarina sedimenti]RUO32107.1 hypothetical protein CWE12_03705 [Aliidiomarina sedimenti]
MLMAILASVFLQVGELEVFDLPDDITRVAVANGDVVEARQLASNELLLLGIAPGHSQIMVWHDSGHLRYQVEVGDREEASAAVPVIELEVQVMEFKQRQLQSLGVRWQQVVNGPALAILSDWAGGDHFRAATQGVDTSPALTDVSLPPGHYVSAGLALSLSSQLHALAEQGVARMLASPVLRTESGEQAHFLAGGEVPLPQTNLQGAMDVAFRQYGIQLSIAPEQLDDGSIRTAVTTEVSNLDAAVSVAGIPGLLTRRTESVVAVQPGESFVISGLRSEQMDHQWQQLPGAERAPLLGGLFRHQQQQQQRTELVIFITPRVVTDDVKQQRKRIEYVEHIEERLRRTPCRGMQTYL